MKEVLLLQFIFFILIAGSGCGVTADPAESGQIPDTNIYVFPDRLITLHNYPAAHYFIKVNEDYLMVDSVPIGKGIRDSWNEFGIDENAVKWILITHSHFDHVNSLASFPNAEIYMSEDEVLTKEGFDVSKIKRLEEGQELSFGDMTVECIKAPGHTIGSMAFFVDGKYLFTGDAFQVQDKGSSVFESVLEKLRETINKSTYILTTHSGYYTKEEFFYPTAD